MSRYSICHLCERLKENHDCEDASSLFHACQLVELKTLHTKELISRE